MSRRAVSLRMGTGSLLAAILATGCAIDQPPSPSTEPVPAGLPPATIAYMLLTGIDYPGTVVVRDLDTGSERTLTRAGYPVGMTLDDDAVFVAEPAEDPGQQRLLLYSVDGGSPADLLDAVFMASAAPSLSPNGRYIALASDNAKPHGLVVLNLVDGTATQLTTDGAGGTPQWSPDSRWIAYQAITANTGSIDVYAISIDGGEPQPIATAPATEVPLGWSAGGAGVVVWTQQEIVLQTDAIRVVDLDDGSSTPLEASPPDGSFLDRPVTSPDGRWELWAVEAGTEVRSRRTTDAPRLLPNSFRAELTWSPDGEWLIWSGRADERDETPPDLFAIRLPDGDPIRLTDTNAEETMPVWGGPVLHPTSEAGS